MSVMQRLSGFSYCCTFVYILLIEALKIFIWSLWFSMFWNFSQKDYQKVCFGFCHDLEFFTFVTSSKLILLFLNIAATSMTDRQILVHLLYELFWSADKRLHRGDLFFFDLIQNFIDLFVYQPLSQGERRVFILAGDFI